MNKTFIFYKFISVYNIEVFSYHRNASLPEITQECDIRSNRTLLMFQQYPIPYTYEYKKTFHYADV